MFRYYFGGMDEINKVGFEDILHSFKINNIILISTLPINEQSYLIKNTISYNVEEKMINDALTQYLDYDIIIYGKNCSDKSIETKYKQLRSLGYPEKNLFVYYGGLFEWSLLKDIYGADFPTTSEDNEILRFKPESKLSRK
jgi:hypothetical protein